MIYGESHSRIRSEMAFELCVTKYTAYEVDG